MSALPAIGATSSSAMDSVAVLVRPSRVLAGPVGLLRVRFTVTVGLVTVLSMTGTVKVSTLVPGPNVSVPLTPR